MTKRCEHCSAPIVRATGMKPGRFEAKRFCGPSCATTHRRANEPKKPEAERRARKIETMRAWYAANPERVAAYRTRPDVRDARNKSRRDKYATDEAYREACIAEARRRNQTPQVKTKKRERNLRAAFGITLHDYDRMLASQGGGCAICGRERCSDRTTRSGPRRLHVDHCHKTGAVRGLLCSSCNMGLGKFNDDADRLERAVAYLRRT